MSGRVLVGLPEDPRWKPLTRLQRSIWIKDPVSVHWPKSRFHCNHCNHECREHPSTKHIVGCLGCGRVSTAIFANFHQTFCTFCQCYAYKHKPMPDTLPVQHKCSGCGGVHVMVPR